MGLSVADKVPAKLILIQNTEILDVLNHITGHTCPESFLMSYIDSAVAATYKMGGPARVYPPYLRIASQNSSSFSAQTTPAPDTLFILFLSKGNLFNIFL